MHVLPLNESILGGNIYLEYKWLNEFGFIMQADVMSVRNGIAFNMQLFSVEALVLLFS